MCFAARKGFGVLKYGDSLRRLGATVMTLSLIPPSPSGFGGQDVSPFSRAFAGEAQ